MTEERSELLLVLLCASSMIGVYCLVKFVPSAEPTLEELKAEFAAIDKARADWCRETQTVHAQEIPKPDLAGYSEESPEGVVLAANFWEHYWYRNLNSTIAEEHLKKYVTGNRFLAIAGRVRRAIARGDKAVEANVKVKILKVTYKILETATTSTVVSTVETEETGRLEWENPNKDPKIKPWCQNDRHHTYFFTTEDSRSKVADDDFDQRSDC